MESSVNNGIFVNIQPMITCPKLIPSSITTSKQSIDGKRINKKKVARELVFNRSCFLLFSVSCKKVNTIVKPMKLRSRECFKSSVDSDIQPPSKQPRRDVIAKRGFHGPKFVAAPKSTLVEGLVVIAKMRTYAAWPASIKSFRKTCVEVHFFGDDTSGTVPYDCIGLVGDNSEIIKQNLNKKITAYAKAVHCMEIVMNVPSSHSIFNQ